MMSRRSSLFFHLQARVDQLEEEKRRLLSRQYGPSSEKAPSAQMRLFNEPEALADQGGVAEAEETITVPAHPRTRGSPRRRRGSTSTRGWM